MKFFEHSQNKLILKASNALDDLLYAARESYYEEGNPNNPLNSIVNHSPQVSTLPDFRLTPSR